LATAVTTGRLPVADLPAGALAWLYVDNRVDGPQLPSGLRDRIEGLVGRAPVEVWEVDPTSTPLTQSGTLLRDGSLCDR
jgi:hypothetical protein